MSSVIPELKLRESVSRDGTTFFAIDMTSSKICWSVYFFLAI